MVNVLLLESVDMVIGVESLTLYPITEYGVNFTVHYKLHEIPEIMHTMSEYDKEKIRQLVSRKEIEMESIKLLTNKKYK